MSMRILIYATNEDRTMVAALKAMHAAAKSTDVVAQRNPRFHHGPADVEKKCKSIIVRPQWTAVIRDYEAAGIEVSVYEPQKYMGPVEETKAPVSETESRLSEPEQQGSGASYAESPDMTRPPEERGIDTRTTVS